MFRDGTVYPFTWAMANKLNRVGAVYGLARDMQNKPGRSQILYVGQTGDLRERIQYWLNNPPVSGIAHFFVEVIPNEAARLRREAELIAEFKPVGNTLLK
jgi:excinuclease UvrABC nuclease subunit